MVISKQIKNEMYFIIVFIINWIIDINMFLYRKVLKAVSISFSGNSGCFGWDSSFLICVNA